MKNLRLSALLLAALAPSISASPQRGGPEREKASATVEVPTESGIAWFGSWEAGLAEAKRTDRPILLMSAAPQCHGVPGMWWPGYRAADGRVLSQKEVVIASREFVCIRPQTYENAAEAEVLSWVFSDRSGVLHNTSFGILSSDGKRKLSETGRSPSMVYETAGKFAVALEQIAAEQKVSSKKPIQALPELPDLRIALDVAAADLRPLVIAYSTDKTERARLRKLLEEQAWSDPLAGRFRYVVLKTAEELEGFKELELAPGISVIEAEAFGRGGAIIAHADSKATALAALLSTSLTKFDARAKNVRDHLRQGNNEGIEWETAIPVTDPGRRK